MSSTTTLSKFQVSAPGKVILYGEHSVVYGKMAVAASLNLRTVLTYTESEKELVIDFVDIGLKQSWSMEQVRAGGISELCGHWENPQAPSETQLTKLKSFVSTIAPGISASHETTLVSLFFLYFSICGPDSCGFHMKIKSELSIGAGLGSSASFSVCLSAAFIHSKQRRLFCEDSDSLNMKPEILSLVSQWAFMSEKIIHLTPSGIDNSICTFGSVISFKSGEVTPIPNAAVLPVLLVDTKVARNTKALVMKARDLYDRQRRMTELILDAMEEVAVTAVNILKSFEGGDTTDKINKLQELVTTNQGLLYALGVSHPTLDLICQIAAKHGIHGKLTGAGGGGYAYLLLPANFSEDKMEQIKQELISSGFECKKTELGAEGVKIDTFS